MRSQVGLESCSSREVLVLSGQTVFHTIWRDVTEQRRLEESLKKTNAKLHALIDAIPDIIFFKDTGGRYLLDSTFRNIIRRITFC